MSGARSMVVRGPDQSLARAGGSLRPASTLRQAAPVALEVLEAAVLGGDPRGGAVELAEHRLGRDEPLARVAGEPPGERDGLGLRRLGRDESVQEPERPRLLAADDPSRE